MTVIEDIEYIEKGGKKFYKIMAKGTYRAFEDTIAFAQLKEGKFKKGDNVDLKFHEAPGKLKDGTAIVYKNLDRIEQVSGSGNEASPPTQTTPKVPATTTKSSSGVNGEMNYEEYREYQKKMMNDCWDDAVKLLNDNHYGEEPTFDVAIAFFDKRNSPRFYAKKEEK